MKKNKRLSSSYQSMIDNVSRELGLKVDSFKKSAPPKYQTKKYGDLILKISKQIKEIR